MPDISPTYGTTALAAPLIPGDTYYLSLHTTDPGTTGANEVTGGSYARQSIVFGLPTTPTPNPSGIQASTTAQTYTGMPAVSGNLWFGVYSLATGGNYFIGNPNSAVEGPITVGATIDFAIAAVTIAAT